MCASSSRRRSRSFATRYALTCPSHFLDPDYFQLQERRHYNDPVLAPAPYLAPSHLRDLVLQHVHSPARRQQLWKQVEKVVEGNANVRAKQVEHQGEEIRAWEWTGVAGAGDLPGTPGTPRMYPKLE